MKLSHAVQIAAANLGPTEELERAVKLMSGLLGLAEQDSTGHAGSSPAKQGPPGDQEGKQSHQVAPSSSCMPFLHDLHDHAAGAEALQHSRDDPMASQATSWQQDSTHRIELYVMGAQALTEEAEPPASSCA